MIDWKPVDKAKPEDGDKLLCWNGIRVIATEWKPGLIHPDAPYPVTHVAALEVPTKPKAIDLTGIEPDAGRIRHRKGLFETCTKEGCGRPHHAKGLCLAHYSRRG